MIGILAVLLVCCAFAVSVLLALAFGARAYQRIEKRTEEGYDRRVALSYIAAKLHAYDAAGQVLVGTFDGLSALYLDEVADGQRYHTILYVSGGWLYELYCQEGQRFAPEDGKALLPVEAITFSQKENIVRAELTDTLGSQSCVQVCLRSAGGAG